MGALSTFVRTTEGAYAIVALLENSLLVARDFLGLRPLYYADEKDVFAVASERKALWDLGAEKVKVFPPGVVAQVERSGACFSPAKRVETSTTRDIGLEEAACKLQELLRQSIIRETSDVDHVGIAFSGGLDSTVLAAVAKETGLEIELVTIGSAFDAELEHAKRAAETLELRQRIQIVEPTEVETLLKKVVWCVEEPTVLSVEVGMAMYIVSSLAVKEGFPVLMLGQGSDELFGGYSRFLEVYAAKGARAVKQAMYESLRDAYRVNFHRDEQVSASLGVELRLPFVHPAVVEFGLTIPLHLMIKSPEDRTRKWVLRRMAQDIGLPEFIVWRSKKAIQYSTGIDDALRKLAKRRGTRLLNLIYETFSKVFDIPIKHIFERVDHSSEAYVRQK